MKTIHHDASGLSIVICCHNSSARLRETFTHLSRQEVCAGRPWEVIVVDNGSTDDTATMASQLWSDQRTPMRIVKEPRPGLAFARERGLAEARYDFVSFVDDDNWVAKDWVDTALGFLLEHPDVGALGGSSTAAFEIEPPRWFPGCQHMYAISPPDWSAGDRTWCFPLWGAGLTLRKQAWLDISRVCIPFLTRGRLGGSMAGGEDVELCYRLLLAGWKLWYEPRLRFQHYMPKERLTWAYARRLHFGAGQAAAALAAYEGVWDSSDSRRLGLSQTWEWKLLQTVKSLIRHPGTLLKAIVGRGRNEPSIFGIDLLLGRLSILVRNRTGFYRARAAVSNLSDYLRERPGHAWALDQSTEYSRMP